MLETIILIVLLVLGTVSHFLKKVVEAWRQGEKITLKQYFISNPYQTIFSIVISLTGFFLLYGSPDLTRITAWAVGFLGDSLAEVIGDRSKVKL